jgi:hypothetical protein
LALTPPSEAGPATVASAAACIGRFIPHDLAHVTTVESLVIGAFETLGAGAAVNDLDGDGYLDIVLGGHDGQDTLLWNEGNLRFRWEAFAAGQTRAVNIVDVDGDNWLDIVLTRHDGAVDYWRNVGADAAIPGTEFVQTPLAGVVSPAFAMSWGDPDGDGDLDLVTASYDSDPTASTGPGEVVYYDNQGMTFVPVVLSSSAATLALAFFDANRDGLPDILAANDGLAPDRAWLREGDGWAEAQPFIQTTLSPRGFAWGDLDNDGLFELLTTGASADPQTLTAWASFATANSEPTANEQATGNVLQTDAAINRYVNQAALWGIDATGWSWSGQFGDFENDGYLDLYIVNGMMGADLFADLPGQELVEENQVFHNNNGHGFIPVPEWDLASTRSGRGMVVADMDNDGDLDIVVNNLRSPAQLFENRLCREDFLEVDLRWTQSSNTRGLGARLTLYADTGVYLRDVHSASGYLSGNPSRVHFGFPVGATLQFLEVRWPDGTVTLISDLAPNTFIEIEYGTAPP